LVRIPSNPQEIRRKNRLTLRLPAMKIRRRRFFGQAVDGQDPENPTWVLRLTPRELLVETTIRVRVSRRLKNRQWTL
jgi:uncharacterized protein (UPF0303 family)